MFQATVILQDSEIGYGEGEGFAYAIADALDNVDSFYRGARGVVVRVIGDSILPVTMPASLAAKIARQ